MSAPFWYLRPDCKPDRQRDLKYIFDRFESFNQAADQRRRRIKVLCRGNIWNKALADRLTYCKREHRCGSNACPVCLRAFRRWFTGEALRVLEKHDNLVQLTIIPHNRQHPAGHLDRLSLTDMNNAFRKRLVRAGLGDKVVIGGIDLSFNVHQNEVESAYWQPHAHLIISSVSPAELGLLREGFMPKPEVGLYRPLQVDQVRDRVAQLSYLVKSYFRRRSSYINGEGRLCCRAQSLKVNQLRESLNFLDWAKPSELLFLQRVRRYGCKLVVADHVNELDRPEGA